MKCIYITRYLGRVLLVVGEVPLGAIGPYGADLAYRIISIKYNLEVAGEICAEFHEQIPHHRAAAYA